MVIVLDSSITMALVMDDEDLPGADAFLERLAQEGAIVPQHWVFEFANALVSAVRRGRMPADQIPVRYQLAIALPIAIVTGVDHQEVRRTLDHAMARGLTVYDAAYLELAVRRGLPLATLDDPLAEAAQAEGLEVIGG